MELDKLKLRNVLYFMQTFVLSFGNKTFDVPRTAIQTLHVDKQFEDQIYPLYYVSMFLPLWVYEELVKTPRDIHVTMHLQYTMVDDVDKAYVGSSKLTTEINGRFLAYIPYTTQPGDTTHQNQFAKASKTYNNTYEYSEGAMVEMALYNESAYKASFNKINAVLQSVTTTDALAYCLNTCGIKNVVLDKADNNQVFNQFIILPQSGMKNILRITDEFKFHSDGSIVFFDLMDSYIVSKKVGCRSWRNNEHKCIYIITQDEFSDTLDNFTGVHIDNDKKFTVIAITGDSFTTQKPDSSPLLRNQPQMDFLTIHTSNATLGLFTPNKEFQFTVDDTAANTYNGKYRLYSLIMDCTPRGEYLDPSFHVIFRK